jgi:hypothetical protein
MINDKCLRLSSTRSTNFVMLLASALLGIVGCQSTPKMPETMGGSSSLLRYYTNEFWSDFANYKGAFIHGDTNMATSIRNAMMNRIRVEIEGNYRDFEANLFTGRETFLTASDFVELGLAGATTIVVGERAKTVLAAILTAVQGARLSIDKNWFREKNIEIVIASMQAERNQKMELIEKKLTGNAMEYPFEEGWVDLIDYFYAGTLEAGIQALGIEAGKTAADAKAANRAATTNRVSHFTAVKKTKKEINKRAALTNKVDALRSAGKKDDALKIAKALNIAVPPGADVFELLQDKIREADDKGEEAVDALLGPFGVQTN